jgi:CRISPR-associated protein Cas1
MVVEQDTGKVSVPLEDIAAIVIDCPQVSLTSQLLSACAREQIAVITVDETHTPNGVLLSYLPHSRALKIMRSQLDMSQPHKKRLWQNIIQQKLRNQARTLELHDQAAGAKHLYLLADKVRSGDPDNYEGQAAQVYFRKLFDDKFHRAQNRFYNAALNYGYSIVRSALARSLVAYGFLPAFGLHHRNEQNAFNLADDLIEPYRPLVDHFIKQKHGIEPERELTPADKASLVNLLNTDAHYLNTDNTTHCSSLLALCETTVISLSQRVDDEEYVLTLPMLLPA